MTKKELASHFNLSMTVVLFLTRSVLFLFTVKQQKELSSIPCWKWLQILVVTFSNYSRYSAVHCRFYSVLFVVHSTAEPSTFCACRIHAVDFISVALGDRYSKFMLMIVGVIRYLLLA